jgi:hypothetical protein
MPPARHLDQRAPEACDQSVSDRNGTASSTSSEQAHREYAGTARQSSGRRRQM